MEIKSADLSKHGEAYSEKLQTVRSNWSLAAGIFITGFIGVSHMGSCICPFGETSYLVTNVEWKFTRESENMSADHQGVNMMRNISQTRPDTAVKV